MTAIQRVIQNGGKSFSDYLQYCKKRFHIVYVVVAASNEGTGGLQTTGSPANIPGAMSVASVDNTYSLQLYTIITPNGAKIIYQAASGFGGWKSIVNLTIVVNS